MHVRLVNDFGYTGDHGPRLHEQHHHPLCPSWTASLPGIGQVDAPSRQRVTSMVPMHRATPKNSQMTVLRTAANPPMIPTINNEITTIHSNVSIPRRPRRLALPNTNRFIRRPAWAENRPRRSLSHEPKNLCWPDTIANLQHTMCPKWIK